MSNLCDPEDCRRFRLGDDSLYRWEFEKGDEAVSIAAPGTLTLDDSHIILGALKGGAGLMYGPEPLLRGGLEKGELEEVLSDWASDGPGFYVYYSSRRQVPTGLRLLIDLIRALRPLGL